MSQQTVPEGYRLNEILPGRYVFTYNGDDPDTPSHHICTNCHAAKKNPSILFWQEPSAPSPFDAIGEEKEPGWNLRCRQCRSTIHFPSDFRPW